MVAKKLLIKDKMNVALLNPPKGFEIDLPKAAKETVKDADVVLLFVADQAALKKSWKKAVSSLREEDGVLWIAYPKISSKMNSDITRDKGWEHIKKDGYEGVSLCSLDETWSAFRVRHEKFRAKRKT